ncbi:prepilin-type N-terminal cleavage/methylation domain-containing protein [Bacillus sp. DNRA2]|uniref:type IV pilus modification PilV family protein n=1 Tax=Bacillus sp. DNRA2 TaxID=2723053 RepID=UPI00145C6B2D|nr:prepilin-type N-terminal cleavage/methylation domain-containing protein [Bacillus sp. DNRA2]NMD70531.1 prepilin-type N-terminal cleavage/methylation domain-containing protein [Bacillus sp. DNRA2]
MILIRSEKGVTLIEVIASITILSIVLITFFNFFPQMGFMNKQNEDKLQGINTAKLVMVKWKESDKVKAIIRNYTSSNVDPNSLNDDTLNYDYGEKINKDEDSDVDALLYTASIGDLTAKIEILVDSDFDSAFKTEAHQIHVTVLNNKDKLLSESYGYVISEPIGWE